MTELACMSVGILIGLSLSVLARGHAASDRIRAQVQREHQAEQLQRLADEATGARALVVPRQRKRHLSSH